MQRHLALQLITLVGGVLVAFTALLSTASGLASFTWAAPDSQLTCKGKIGVYTHSLTCVGSCTAPTTCSIRSEVQSLDPYVEWRWCDCDDEILPESDCCTLVQIYTTDPWPQIAADVRGNCSLSEPNCLLGTHCIAVIRESPSGDQWIAACEGDV
jgi:hypothetical protein